MEERFHGVIWTEFAFIIICTGIARYKYNDNLARSSITGTKNQEAYYNMTYIIILKL